MSGSRSITTGTGDGGHTTLLFSRRVSKTHPLIEAVGAVDELNAALGTVRAAQTESATLILDLQKTLVSMMGELACTEEDVPRYFKSKFTCLDDSALDRVDEAIRELASRNLPQDGWATPGSNPASAALDIARVTARRMERRIAALPEHGRHLAPCCSAMLTGFPIYSGFWHAKRSADLENFLGNTPERLYPGGHYDARHCLDSHGHRLPNRRRLGSLAG